jgi:2-keto-4-pentenoate hydratase/2-oxohepta-3-ene-1,7-dioic acid hydratase in catechol pathway
MKLALISPNHPDNHSSSATSTTASLSPPWDRQSPADLVIGDGERWWMAKNILPPDVLTGTAFDATLAIRNWDHWRSQFRFDAPTAPRDLLDRGTLLPPIVEPSKIICIGLNYADHATETGADLPTLPVVFNKFPTTLIGHKQPIVLPSISEKVDFEAELVVVIGKPCRHVSAAQAMDHVFGYTCGHDVSARDWQKGRPGGQWLLGKTFDSFAPLGPWIVTAESPNHAENLRVQFRLNGETMQDGSTHLFIFSIASLVEHLSKFCTLLPGDLLFTGTPSGVGVARTPPVFMQPGDLAEVEIEGIGTLVNPVVADAT